MIYKYAVVVLAFLCSAASALSEAEYQSAFTGWMQKYQKSYSNAEFQNRYNIFKQNLDYVNAWNLANTDTKLDTNFLADLSNEEYQRVYLGTHFDGTERLAASPKSVVDLSDAPASVNWVTAGAVTAVKNQGQCGSCWSFSTTGSTEGAHKLKTGNLVSLSEQNLIDCSTKYGNQGCNGGLMDSAFKYIIANKGLDTEASYPYTTSGPNKCQYKAANSGATLSSFQDVTSGSESALQTAVVQQPISVAIDASHTSFQLYSSGVYYEAACSTTQLDHGVLAAGYGTDSSNSMDYWLVKNSWGASWGQAGYIWMSRNKNNNCGIATMASYPIA